MLIQYSELHSQLERLLILLVQDKALEPDAVADHDLRNYVWSLCSVKRRLICILAVLLEMELSQFIVFLLLTNALHCF